jgi:SAM-dependent methyltransferase
VVEPSDGMSEGEPGVCAVCGGAGRRLFATRGYDIFGCRECGHRFAQVDHTPDHVRRVYGDDYFFGGGAGYADYLSEAALLRERGVRYARLLRRHVATGTVLDVGAAAGFVLEGFLSEGWEGRGVEPNSRMCAAANERLGPLVDVGILESYESPRTYDLVAMIQVVAHFPDPRLALARAAAQTSPGGFWLIETWDRDSWTARAFGQRWHEYSPPSVLHWFSRSGLERLAGSLGFAAVAWGHPRRWIDLGHARSLLEHKLSRSVLRHLLQPLRLVPSSLRLPYLGDDLFWALFRDERRGRLAPEVARSEGGPVQRNLHRHPTELSKEP